MVGTKRSHHRHADDKSRKKVVGNDGKSTESYKKSHNIGNRRATNLPNSYRESDVAVLFDKSYFSNFRYSMTFGRGTSKDSPGKGQQSPDEGCIEAVESAPVSSSPKKDQAGGSKCRGGSGGNKRSWAPKRSLEIGNGSREPSSENTPYKRSRRTASLNAGAILTAMLEKPSSSAKKKNKGKVKDSPTKSAAGGRPSHSASKPSSAVSPRTPEKPGRTENFLDKSFVDMSRSPIHVEVEPKRGRPSKSNGDSGEGGGGSAGGRKSKGTIQLDASDEVSCIDLTAASEGTSEGRASGRDEGRDVGRPGKPERSPTLSSSSSSATILNFEAGESHSKKVKLTSPGGGNSNPAAKKRLKSAKEPGGGTASRESAPKASRRLASLNATAVLAACLDTQRRPHKAKKVGEKRATTGTPGGAPGTCAAPIVTDGNDGPPSTSKKQSPTKKLPSPGRSGKVPQAQDRGRAEEAEVLRVKVAHKNPHAQNSVALSPGGASSSKTPKNPERKQTTRVAPWKSPTPNLQPASSPRLLASAGGDSGTPAVSRLHQAQRNFSAVGRSSGSAVVATILPSQICFARPSSSAFSGYQAGGVPAPITSLLFQRQPFQTAPNDPGLTYASDGKPAYQNLSVLRCAGNGVQGAFSPTPPPPTAGSYLAPPTATVLFGASQQHINLQLCPPMAYGQVCRPFSPTGPSPPSFFRTLPFGQERFQFCHSPSSPPLGLSGPSSHLFIPYGIASTVAGLSPPTMVPCPSSQPQGKKRSGRGRTSAPSDGHGFPPSAPLAHSGGKLHPTQALQHHQQQQQQQQQQLQQHHQQHQQYVKISPKKIEHPPTTSSSSLARSVPEVGRILRFVDEEPPGIVPAVSPRPVDLSRPVHPTERPATPNGKARAKKRVARSGTERNGADSSQAKRVHDESKPVDNNASPRKEVETKQNSSSSSSSSSCSSSLSFAKGKKLHRPSDPLGISLNEGQPAVRPSPDSSHRAKAPECPRSVVARDAKIDCSVVLMGTPVEHSSGKVVVSESKVKPSKEAVEVKASVDMKKKMKKKEREAKRGRLLSAAFLKSLSPSRGFLKAGRKRRKKAGNDDGGGLSPERRKLLRRRGKGQDRQDPIGKSSLAASEGVMEKVSSWSWLGEPEVKSVSVQSDGAQTKRVCYPAIRHATGDVVKVKDCVFVRSGTRKRDIPYIAKIYGLWEEGDQKEMTMGVFWYYRREHVESEVAASRYLDDEVFASRHRDAVPVACIEDRCFVLPFDQYCRYRAEVSRLEWGAGRSLVSRVVPPLGSLAPSSSSEVEALEEQKAPEGKTLEVRLSDEASEDQKMLEGESSDVRSPNEASRDNCVTETCPEETKGENSAMDGCKEMEDVISNLHVPSSSTGVDGTTVPEVCNGGTSGSDVPLIPDGLNTGGGHDASGVLEGLAEMCELVEDVESVAKSLIFHIADSAVDEVETREKREKLPSAADSPWIKSAGVSLEDQVDQEASDIPTSQSSALNGVDSVETSARPPTPPSHSKDGVLVEEESAPTNGVGEAVVVPNGETKDEEHSGKTEGDVQNDSGLMEIDESRVDSNALKSEEPLMAVVPSLKSLCSGLLDPCGRKDGIPLEMEGQDFAPGLGMPLHSDAVPRKEEELKHPVSAHGSTARTEPSLVSGSTARAERLAVEVDRDNVFLCRHIYDIKLRRISKNPNIALHASSSSSQTSANGGGGTR